MIYFLNNIILCRHLHVGNTVYGEKYIANKAPETGNSLDMKIWTNNNMCFNR